MLPFSKIMIQSHWSEKKDTTSLWLEKISGRLVFAFNFSHLVVDCN